MMRSISRGEVAALAVLAGLMLDVTQPVSAANTEAEPVAAARPTVQYLRFELWSQSGRRSVRERIAEAAREACSSPAATQEPFYAKKVQLCMETVQRDALAKVGRALQ
jgi:UrcA family protein